MIMKMEMRMKMDKITINIMNGDDNQLGFTADALHSSNFCLDMSERGG